MVDAEKRGVPVAPKAVATGRAASGLRVLRFNVQEVRLSLNPCPSLHLGIFERQLGNN